MSPAKVGDTFYLRANYDLTKYGGMKTDDGKLDEASITRAFLVKETNKR
jgi:hypothetical protein